MVRDSPLFMVTEGEEAGAPFRLSGNFQNSRGEPSLQIIENEFRVLNGNWDAEATGGTIKVRDAPGHFSLCLKAQPPEGLVVERLDMYAFGYRFEGDADTLTVRSPSGRVSQMTRCIADNGRVGLVLG